MDNEESNFSLRHIEFEVLEMLNSGNLNTQIVLFSKELELMRQNTSKHFLISQTIRNLNQIILNNTFLSVCI